MTPPARTRAPIESPCINVCVIHPETRLCTGCARSIDEITGWARMTPDARRAIMADLPGRRAVPTGPVMPVMPALRRCGRDG